MARSIQSVSTVEIHARNAARIAKMRRAADARLRQERDELLRDGASCNPRPEVTARLKQIGMELRRLNDGAVS